MMPASSAPKLYLPLEIHNLPMVGKSGARDNLEVLVQLMNQLVARPFVVMADVRHDDACPCPRDAAPFTACTCELVDVVLHIVDPRLS